MEKKIVLAQTEEYVLCAFVSEYKFEYVVATKEEVMTYKIGQEINGWYNGHYFMQDLERAVKYLAQLEEKEDEE